MDKYEELYNLSKYLLNHEIERAKRIDEKASKYLAVVSLLVGIYGFFANWLLSEVIPLKQWSFLEFILAFLTAWLLVSLFFTWVAIFSSLHVTRLKQIPMNDAMIKFFDENRPIDIWYALARRNKEAVLENRKEVDRKAKRLSEGYVWTAATVTLFVLLASLFGYYKVEKGTTQLAKQTVKVVTAKRTHRGDWIYRKKKINGTQGGTGKTEPEPNVKPQTYDMLVEGGCRPVEIKWNDDKCQKEQE